MGNKIMSSRAFVDEKYTRPQGEFDPKDGDYRKLRRLILNGQLAPCFPGTEECTSELDECPICFLFYPSLNRSRCCSKAICTECYLQIKSGRFARSTQCPFCKTSSYTVEYRGAKTLEEKGVEQAEEQRVIEAKIRIRQKELHDEEERVRRLGEGTQAEPSERETNLTLMEPDFEAEPDMSAQVAHVQGSLHRLNINDGLDLDVEDMMLMEAIWLSIQEQGQMRQDFALAQQIPTSSALGETGIFNSNQISTEIAGRRYSVTGGLTRAIAALAERQATTAETRVGDRVVRNSQNFLESGRNLNANHNDMPSREFRDLATRSCTIDPSRRGLGASRALQKEKQDVPWEKRQNGERNWQNASCGSEELNGWVNVSKESGRTFCSSVQREDRELTFDWGLDQSSEAVEAGTSFSSSIPSASDLPWEAPDILSSRSSDNVGETSLSIASARVLPMSYEEQIMLAMALSLAEAQPQARRQ